MNTCTLIGNVVKDPITKKLKRNLDNSESTVSEFSIAVKGKKTKDGHHTDYFEIRAFNKISDVIANYVKGGHKIAINGTITPIVWDKPDGTKGYATHIYANAVELLTNKIEAERMAGIVKPDTIINPNVLPPINMDDLIIPNF
jgi:single-strand DNA-binding protein